MRKIPWTKLKVVDILKCISNNHQISYNVGEIVLLIKVSDYSYIVSNGDCRYIMTKERKDDFISTNELSRSEVLDMIGRHNKKFESLPVSRVYRSNNNSER